MYIAHIVNTTHTLQLIKEHQIEKKKSKHSFQFCSTIATFKNMYWKIVYQFEQMY